MNKITVRPVLCDPTYVELPIYIIGKCIKPLSDVKLGELRLIQRMMFSFEHFIPQEIILISLDPKDKIEVNDFYWDELTSSSPSVGILKMNWYTDTSKTVIQSTVGTTTPISMAKKLISTQSQISSQDIQTLIDKYNTNGEFESIEVDMETHNKCACGGYNLYSIIKPKLTNGFITIVERGTCDKCSKDCKKQSTTTNEFGSCIEFEDIEIETPFKKERHEDVRQLQGLFRINSDCYMDGTDEEHSNTPAMSEEKFIEVVSNLLSVNNV
jgi:hypothetical protein